MQYRQVDFTKRFTKQFSKLRLVHQEQFYLRLSMWHENPDNPLLRDHALKGKYVGYRSIDIAPDVRALYYVQSDVLVIFALIGTHSQLYG